ncbi:MAG: serine hydrolase domain-containing protein [Pseudomonadota bacterium]
MIRRMAAIAAAMTVSACVSSSPPQSSQNTAAKTSLLSVDVELVPAVRFANDAAPAQSMRLEDRMVHYGASAVSVAVLQAGEIVHVEAIGTVSAQSDKPATPDLLFQAASISKPVSAIGAMTLVDDGRVDLDADVEDYLQSWSLPNDTGDPVTLRELLSHTSGVSVPSYPGFEKGADLPTLDDILAGAPNAYSAPVVVAGPQGEYAYSGGGYMVAQKMIEDVAGASFSAFMAEKVFAPAGMTQSSFDQYPDEAAVVFGHDWRGARLKDGWQPYPQLAPAGLWTTPRDLARLMQSYFAAYRGDDTQLLSAEAARAMAVSIASDTGLGFGVDGEGAEKRLTHAGWTIGYRSYLLFYPETGDGIVVMANAQAANHLVSEVIRMASAEFGWPEIFPVKTREAALLSEEQRRALAGEYRFDGPGFSISVTQTGDRFRIETPRGTVYEAVAVGPRSLIILETGDEFEIDPDDPMLATLWGMTAQKQ